MKNNYRFFRAPARLNHDLSLDPEIFNLTMTVRLDSDIPWPYGEISDLKTGKVVAPAIDVNWNQPEENFEGFNSKYSNKNRLMFFPTDEKIMNIFKKKSKTAAWFVSNCYGKSLRNDLVKKLQMIGIQVDV